MKTFQVARHINRIDSMKCLLKNQLRMSKCREIIMSFLLLISLSLLPKLCLSVSLTEAWLPLLMHLSDLIFCQMVSFSLKPGFPSLFSPQHLASLKHNPPSSHQSTQLFPCVASYYTEWQMVQAKLYVKLE